jgi:hypothetical protein
MELCSRLIGSLVNCRYLPCFLIGYGLVLVGHEKKNHRILFLTAFSQTLHPQKLSPIRVSSMAKRRGKGIYLPCSEFFMFERG